jgi:2-hydroxychromene-2-carboxylate isomerase
MGKPVDYFFAPVSGFAYLGHDAFLKIAKDTGAEVTFRPFDVVGVFKTQGTTPPPAQGDIRLSYRREDMTRWAVRRGLPLKAIPAHWPAPAEPSGRAILATEALGHDVGAVAGAMLRGIWAEDRNLADKADLAAILDGLDLPSAEILATAESPGIGVLFEEHTKAALDARVFGSPTWVIDGVRYFGQDRLDFVADALAG